MLVDAFRFRPSDCQNIRTTASNTAAFNDYVSITSSPLLLKRMILLSLVSQSQPVNHQIADSAGGCSVAERCESRHSFLLHILPSHATLPYRARYRRWLVRLRRIRSTHSNQHSRRHQTSEANFRHLRRRHARARGAGLTADGTSSSPGAAERGDLREAAAQPGVRARAGQPAAMVACIVATTPTTRHQTHSQRIRTTCNTPAHASVAAER